MNSESVLTNFDIKEMADCDNEINHMASSAELELYAQIRHETDASLSADFVKPVKNRIVSKRNNSVNKNDASKFLKRKSTKERCNPNPFAISSALNVTKPKRLTPNTPSLFQIDSKPVDPLESFVPRKKIDQQPNPLSHVNKKKINRVHSKQLNKIEAADISNTLLETTEQITINLDSDDDLIILPPVIPLIYDVYSSDEENAIAEPELQQNNNLDNAIPCDFINEERQDNLFGGSDASKMNEIVSFVDQCNNVSIELIHDFAKPQRTNRHSSNNKSYEVAKNDFAATDVYESESSDLTEGVSKGKKTNRIMSGSVIEVETSNRPKRMRKRKSSGSNCSDYVSDDSDEDGINYVVEKDVVRPFVLSGEAIPNAITTRSSIVHCDKSKEQPAYIDMDGDSSSESNIVASIGNSSNWLVTDQVGAPDDIEIDSSIPNDIFGNDEMQPKCENKEQNESNVADKDDVNCVRSKRLVIHPEMGWNHEMKAFYNDSWGGESYDSKALRKQMPPKNSMKWPIVEADRRANYHVSPMKCSNCRERGHRMQYCPQPERETVCYTCGTAGHRSNNCPICLRCGAKSNSYVKGCKDCLYLNGVHCTRCKVRGHLERDCPENWRSYHNTIDSVSSPKYVPNPHRPKKCAAPGHIAEYSLKEEMPSTSIRRYEKNYRTNMPPIDNSKTTPYVMFEKPRENFEFNWNVNKSKDRIYGRFMEATKIIRNPQIETIKANLGARMVKRRRLNDDMVVDSSNQKMVFNPMNPKNIRRATKLKKQFSKDFELTESAIAQANDCENNIDSANVAAESILENHENQQPEELENGLPEGNTEIVMKDTEVVPELTKDDVRVNDDVNVEKTIQADGGDGEQEIMDDNALMLEAIEVDELKGFSFKKEMQKIEYSKRMFGIGFNVEPTNFHVVKKLPASKIEINENYAEAELRELNEAQETLINLKRRLSTMKKPKDSFGEYFEHSKKTIKTEEKDDDADLELPEYIPPRIESPTNIANQAGISQRFINTPPSTKTVNEAKIFLSKEQTRMLLTEAGNNFLHESSIKSQIKLTMGWESVGNVLMVVGSKLNQDKFHADLVKYLEAMNKKVRLRNETLQLLPKSKVALIRFIREQFDLLLQPLGNPQLLYNHMRMNENLKTKAGTKNADKSRIKLNTILMGQGGLRDGPKHLSGLEKNLKFLLENNKDMMTKQLREEIFQHYRYIFSSYTHDNYPELISEYNELEKSNNLPEMKVDRRLLELNMHAKDEDCRPVDLDLAKRKIMHMTNEEYPRHSGKSAKLEQIPKLDKNQRDESKKGEENAIWSLKCKKILKECRELPRIRGSILQKFDLLIEKANNHGLSYDDFIDLNRIKESLIETQN